MNHIYEPAPRRALLTITIFLLYSSFSMAQQSNKTDENFFESADRPQFFLNINYLPKAGERETYLRKGYMLKAGFVKPFYNWHTDNFAKVYAIVIEAGYGQTDAKGALEDIINTKIPLSIAVPNSLNPFFSVEPGKATVYNLGAGLRQDLHFKKISMGITASTGYQYIKRPAFTLIDKDLIQTVTGDKLIYARSVAQSASGIYFKPAFDISYRITDKISFFATVDYTFGPAFDGTQTNLIIYNTGNDAYLTADEIRAGYLYEQFFAKPVNMLSTGIGIKYYLSQ